MFKFLSFTLALFLSLFCLGQAQNPPAFAGHWTASGDDTVLTFQLEIDGRSVMTIVTNGQQESYSANWRVEDGQLLIDFDDGSKLAFEASVSGDELSLTNNDNGDITVLTKVTNSPIDRAVDDLFSGQYSGQDIALELAFESGIYNYKGVLNFKGQTYPVEASSEGNKLTGTFTANGSPFDFEAVLIDNDLELTTGNTSYQLKKLATNTLEPSGEPVNTLPQTEESPIVNRDVNTGGLVGKWVYSATDEFSGQTEIEEVYLLPDGRYFLDFSSKNIQFTNIEPTTHHEEGLFNVSGNTINFTPWCDSARDFQFTRSGNEITLSGQNVAGESFSFVYELEPGSKTSVIEEAHQVDAERAKNNQPYLARTPTGPVQAGQRFTEVGVPVDPNVDNSFVGATVFSDGELYTYISSWYYAFDFLGQFQTINSADIVFGNKQDNINFSRGTYRDTAQWHFFPNGRLYSKTEIYGTATSLDPLTPNTIDFWARYKIEDDILLIEEDQGEVSTFYLLDGRRVMSSGQDICYQEVEWATESLEQQTEELNR